MKRFRPAKKRITVSAGESVRIIRELRSLSQNQPAQLTGIPHPAVLVFPVWEDHLQTAA